MDEELDKDTLITDSVQFVQRTPYQADFEGFRTFKRGGQIIHAIQYADILLLVKEAAMLRSITEGLLEI
jgi:hypothetical protein